MPFNSPEKKLSPLHRKLLSVFAAESCLNIFEIGSCDGIDAITYGELFPNAAVFAFEPVPANFLKVQSNIDSHQAKNVTAFAVALSDKIGMTDMFVPTRDENNSPKDAVVEQSSSLLPPDRHLELYPWCRFDNIIPVETDTLQHFCTTHTIDTLHFAHLDVQGAELMVLKGAGNFIRNILSIWLEVEHVSLYKNQPLRKDVEAFMTGHGFILVKFRVGGYSGDQFYVQEKFIRETKGSLVFSYLKLKSYFLRSAVFVAANRYARKLKYLLKK